MVAPNTNIVRYSGVLDSPRWAKNNLAVAKLAVGSPTGHAWRCIATGTEGNGIQYIGQVGLPEFKPNVTYTLSVWVQRENWPPAGKLFLWLLNRGQGETGAQSIGQFFTPDDNVQPFVAPSDLSGPGLPPWANVAGGVEYLAGNWQRIWVQGTSPSKPGCTFEVYLTTLAGFPQGDVGSSFLCGGFSLVEGADTSFADTTSSPRGTDFLPVFDFPYHLTETRYPQNGTSVQFGGSYNFTAKASGPPQRVFALEFATLMWYEDFYTGQVDPIINQNINAGALDLFYRLVQLSDHFTYPHPVYGNLRCRFLKPLVLPKSIPGGTGATERWSVELIEVPL